MSDRDFRDVLRGAGLRVTAPRLAVLAVISKSKHVDAESIISQVRSELGKVSQQTVYDTLHALTDVGSAVHDARWGPVALRNRAPR